MRKVRAVIVSAVLAGSIGLPAVTAFGAAAPVAQASAPASQAANPLFFLHG